MKRFFLPFLLLATLCIGLLQAKNVGFTTDEGIHVASAYLAIERGDFRFDPEHPFLFKYLTAAPLFALTLNAPEGDAELWDYAASTFYDSWREARLWSDRWFYTSGNPTEAMIFLSRVPGVLTLVGLVYALYYLVKLGSKNENAALATAFVAAITPTFLAHGPTTNTDIPLALASVLVLIYLYKYHEKPTATSALFVALSLLVAVTTKFSGVLLLIPAFIWVVLVMRRSSFKAAKVFQHFAIALFTLWAGIWVIYGFHSPYVPLQPGQEQTAYTEAKERLAKYGVNPDELTIARRFLPSAYTKGFILTSLGSITGRGTYILGERFPYGGTPIYFPALFVLKTPLALFIPLLFALKLTRKTLLSPRKWSPYVQLLAITGLFIAFMLVRSKLNIGFRHASSLLPILTIAMGYGLAELYKLNRRYCYAVIALAITPFFFQKSFDLISFANTPINPERQYQLYDDSNLDWGQETKVAAAYIKENYPDAKVYYNPWRSTEAWEYYLGRAVVPYDNLEPPTDGIIVLTASQKANEAYAVAFRYAEPLAIIGNGTAFIYRF